MFAAAALGRLGEPPLVVNLFPKTVPDDEHLLAVFRRHGAWGRGQVELHRLAVSRADLSNLRNWSFPTSSIISTWLAKRRCEADTRPLNLNVLDRDDWLACDATMDRIAERLSRIPRIALLTPAMAVGLLPIDERSYRGGLLGADLAGLYRPEAATGPSHR